MKYRTGLHKQELFADARKRNLSQVIYFGEKPVQLETKHSKEPIVSKLQIFTGRFDVKKKLMIILDKLILH